MNEKETTPKEDLLKNSKNASRKTNKHQAMKKFWKDVGCSRSFVLILLVAIAILVSIGVLLPYFPIIEPEEGPVQCSIELVESIPEGLVYNDSRTTKRTFEAWTEILDLTKERLQLASSYWTLLGEDTRTNYSSDHDGRIIFERIKNASKAGVEIYIAQNLQPNNDTDELSTLPGVHVRSLNFTHLLGAGILHTKLWISDEKHIYVGSANFDWRSLTQVKEMGILVKNCPVLARDMSKIFEVYWILGGQNKKIPSRWPRHLRTKINMKSPLTINNTENDLTTNLYLSSSPKPFCPEGRTRDLDSILQMIDESEKFIYIAVMDYFPSTIYQKNNTFWPIIDDRLREAAINRGVEVRLLLSQWPHTRPSMIRYLKSLVALSDDKRIKIYGKMFEVPSFTPEEASIPYARVNHNKYMVTDKRGFIGTSNWSADYFLFTGGIGVTFDGQVGLRSLLEDVFLRDWNSSYATSL